MRCLFRLLAHVLIGFFVFLLSFKCFGVFQIPVLYQIHVLQGVPPSLHSAFTEQKFYDLIWFYNDLKYLQDSEGHVQRGWTSFPDPPSSYGQLFLFVSVYSPNSPFLK